ncbi:MAG: RsmB/NOP family class I SAM-dependent RNA methyltransferase [Bilifractor sp.]|jgi:NOL1/NOP2/sun family putative RNA methylase
MKLPNEFDERMKNMLGNEYADFIASYDRPRLRGLRVNTMKITPEEFEKIAPFPVRRVPWVTDGFIYPNDVYPARHPYYAAGVYYLQEPSAMTPASRLPVEPGDRVLDLCAAPGGKATELAARLGGTGILVANDASNSRAKALLRNLELFGTENMFVTNEMPDRLADVFTGYFDKILVDAPCSGEGMFRKDPEVAETWSPERVRYFASQQRNILENARKMLKPGGYLMYSTCTFSPDEDEQMISWLIRTFPDLSLQEMEGYSGFSEGRPDWADGNPELRKCVRIWPHRMDGEGHFLALMRRDSSAEPQSCPGSGRVTGDGSASVFPAQWEISNSGDGFREVGEGGCEEAGLSGQGRRNCSGSVPSVRSKKKTRADRTSANGRASGKSRGRQAAASDVRPDAEQMELLGEFLPQAQPEKIERRADKGYYVQKLPDGAGRLNFLRNGLYLGEWKKKRFEPSQPLAMAEHPEEFRNVFSLKPEDERVARYLHGETIQTDPETERVCSGWNLICVDRFPIGWGKYANGIIKNKYAASWRK